MLNVSQVIEELNKLADPEQAIRSRKFFKSKTDQYTVDDLFIGVRVPAQRTIAKKYFRFSLAAVRELLKSNIHEVRSLGLLVLVSKYQHSREFEGKKKVVKFYLDNFQNINTWDLVDLSASQLLGEFLAIRMKGWNTLIKLTRSENVWKRRTAIVSTLALLRKRQNADQSLIIASELLHDDCYLVQSAVGWVLREVGKQVSEKQLTNFLDQHYQEMSRLTLRYAIEKLSSQQKKHYLKK